MSLRAFGKQSPLSRGDCFPKARNHRWRQMFSPNGIKTILFDLDGTLRLNLPAGGEVFCEHAISLGLLIGNNDRLHAARWEHYYWAGSPELFADLGIHRDDTPDFWLNYGRR